MAHRIFFGPAFRRLNISNNCEKKVTDADETLKYLNQKYFGHGIKFKKKNINRNCQQRRQVKIIVF